MAEIEKTVGKSAVYEPLHICFVFPGCFDFYLLKKKINQLFLFYLCSDETWVIFKLAPPSPDFYLLWDLIVRRIQAHPLKALTDTGSWHRHNFTKPRDSVPFS